MFSDTDPQVQKGAQLLDRLLKDVATEDENFEVDSFVLLLKDRLYVKLLFSFVVQLCQPFCKLTNRII